MNIIEPLAIYVHWPYCVSKCPYCDFNSHVAASIDHAAWRVAYLAELDYYVALTPGRVVTSIFFGGGTPSLMQPATVAAVIDGIAARWPIAPDVEITAEANPGSADRAVFEGFAASGINRVSIGVQSFDDDALAFLGRRHDAGEAHRAIELAARLFPRFSFDLIYARPGQGVGSWQAELARALQYAPLHISLYQLTIEQGTKFEGLHSQGAFTLPDGDEAAALYHATGEALGHAGLLPYEVSNYAAPGQESRHNLAYWRYRDYLGIGPGAHGRVTLEGRKYATRAHRAPDAWLARVTANGHGAHAMELLAPEDRLREMLMMGLRLLEPVTLERIEAETGRGLTEWIDPATLQRLAQEGYLTLTDYSIAATAEGRIRLGSVLQYLLRTVESRPFVQA